jgi:hypothetical protein
MNRHHYYPLLLLVLFSITISCGKKGNERAAPDPIETDNNQLLEKEAWRIHDEVMPKMGALHKWKTRMKEKIDSTPDMTVDKQTELEGTIRELENAYQGMMDWMHNFKPEKHDANPDSTREYLENQIEEIKQVKNNILEALTKAEATAM